MAMRQAPEPGPAAMRRHGPAVGEPPPRVDPRRGGSIIGLAGGMVFIASYSPVLGSATSATAWVLGLTGVAAALFAHYIRPVPLGPLARPSLLALATYVGCVAGELALIALGSRAFEAVGRGELRPALIAAVVGLHFLPFAWAFRERMFFYLGGAVATLGAIGLLAGTLGVVHAAEAGAVTAGLVMIVFIVMYALGRFPPEHARAGRGAASEARG